MRRLPVLAWGVLLLAATPARARQVPADDAPPAAPAADDEARIAEERTADETAYATLVRRRERLLHEHLGRWVVIAGGRPWPADEHGFPQPAETMEAAVAAATAGAPDARHRFVFRVGEDGDVEMAMGGTQVSHVLGRGWMALLGGALSFDPPGEVRLVREGSEAVKISTEGPEGRPYVRPEVGAPGVPGRAEDLYILSTGCSGYGAIPAPTAARLALHRWEIPGMSRITGAFDKKAVSCRRARLHVRLAAADLDVTVPVAVLPRGP